MSDWSNLAEDARARTGEPGPRCGVEAFLNGLPVPARLEAEAALADRSLTNTGLFRAFRVLAGDGSPGSWSISNHRVGGCRCGR